MTAAIGSRLRLGCHRVLCPAAVLSQMRMSLLTGAYGEAGSVPVTSMVYAPGASPSRVIGSSGGRTGVLRRACRSRW